MTNDNSASQYSPFRYPGGKSWFLPRFRQWLKATQPAAFIEPFAGGASASCCAALEGLAEKIVINELDPKVYVVWDVIFSYPDELCRKLLAFEMTHENVKREFEKPPRPTQLAFQTLLRNRIAHGGRISSEAGILKHGEDGKGLLSRWNPETLVKRIQALHAARDKVVVFNDDALACMEWATKVEVPCAVFIDPPYTAGGKKAGQRLYDFNEVDHEQVFALAAKLDNPLLTYDNNAEVIALCERYGLKYQPIAMRSAHHEDMTELMIGKDLTWHDEAALKRTRPSRRKTKNAAASEPSECSPMLTG